MINISTLKAADKVNLTHSRKGRFNFQVIDNSDDRWIHGILLSEKIYGLSSSWVEGEELTLRKSFCTIHEFIK